LLICSGLALFILIERLIALRPTRIIPNALVEAFMQGSVLTEDFPPTCSGSRIVHFYKTQKPKPEALKAFASLETTRLERGFFILEIVVGAAPLIGLLGTVTGLIHVFSNISPETGLPETQMFIQGIALALTTTMLGLAIAIPAMAAHAYLTRKVEVFSSQLQVGVERLINLSEHQSES